MRHGIVKHYTRESVTTVWRPGVCIHSRRCFHGLPAVFDPSRRPWVNLDGAELVQDGPLVLRGQAILALPGGAEQACPGTTAFCRCGASGRKPFCDGSHRQSGFKG